MGALTRGRPSKLDTLDLSIVEMLAEKGFTDKEMAKILDVSEVTFNAWKKKNDNFLKSLKKGKSIADAQVEVSLYERATGYDHDDIHFSSYEGIVTETPYIKHIAPDPTSMIFWLKNRQPERWRDKRDVELSGLNDTKESDIDAKIAALTAKINGKNEPA